MSAPVRVTSTPETRGQAYEELRRCVLAGNPRGGPLGLVVLLREGMAAWITCVTVESTASTPAVDPQQRTAGPQFSVDVQGGVVRQLASMALASRTGGNP